MPRLIDGRRISEEIERGVEAEVRKLQGDGHIPHLVALQVGQNHATDVYVQKQKERLSRLGIQYTHVDLDQTTSLEALLSHVDALNKNPTVTGIISTMPLPPSIPAPKVQERILPEKDVEGVNPSNLGRLIYNRR